MDENELSAGPSEVDLFAKSEAKPGYRENAGLVGMVVLLGVAGVVLSFLVFPGFFDGDMAKNLAAEAVGASVIAGAVFILLRMQDHQRWKGAEAIAASRLSHWLTRMYLNASIPLLAGGARPVEFGDPENRVGFTIHSGVTIESVREQVLKALEVMRVPADDPAATSRVQKYFDSVEAEFGVGTWDIVQSRIHHDLEMISDTMSRFDTVLLRNLPLFERLADLEEIKSFMDGSSSPELIYHGFYGLVFRRAEAIIEELSRLGYASRLRTHDLR